MMRILICSLLLISSFCTKGQSFSYQYDNAGNRIQRQIVFPKKGSNNGQVASQQDSVAFAEELGGGDNIAIYPNPVTHSLKLNFSKEEQAIKELRIIDQRGQLHFQKKNLIGDQELDFSALSSGTYFVSLKLKGQKPLRYTIVKQ